MSNRVLYTAFDVVPSPKGASRHITHFTQALVDAGHDVTLLTVGLADLPQNETYAGAHIIRYRDEEENFLRRALRFGDAVWEHLRDHEGAYDVVHFRDIWSGAAALKARRHFGYAYRTLFEANGLPSVELKYHYPGLRESELLQKLKAQELAVLQQADATVCVSSVTALYLESLGVLPNQVVVIPNGVDPACFRPNNGPEARQPRIMYVGTLADWQGIHTPIEAMPTILAAFPEAKLYLIGPAKSRHMKKLVKLAAKLGLDEEDIRFVGSVHPEEIPKHLGSASVCVAPLTYNDRNVVQGCCPIKLLEYAAAARPIVAANLPIVRELLREGDALFFEPGDAAEMAHQTIHLLSSPEEAQAMAERAAQHVRETFTWQHAGERLLKVYAHLIQSAQ